MTNEFLRKNIAARVDINSAHVHCAELIHDLFKNAPQVIRPITTHMLSAPGKGVRTSMLFFSAMGADGLIPKEAIAGAAAVEIFHLATLVHDDVIDDADTRRGIQSVQSKFSKKEAILCGDFLFGLAFAAIADIYEPYTEFAKKFANSVSKICLGELRQYSNNFNSNIHLYEYIKTIRGKTAVLFHISAYGGGLIGGASKKELMALGMFGTYFGMMFQIVDDCKDYVLNGKQAKKPTLIDISSGVVNLPLIMAYLREPELRKQPLTIALIQDVQRLGGVNDAFAIAKMYEQKAYRILSRLENKSQIAELKSMMVQVLCLIKESNDA